MTSICSREGWQIMEVRTDTADLHFVWQEVCGSAAQLVTSYPLSLPLILAKRPFSG
uniref:Uncharacterized protein n=1 Tax=Physcomitrium patens TaxID=3218 RepID=A0A2K1JY17_PHYPA|nr:hypothetical protein PHYPA_013541 [Physcomitrium patens]